MLKLERQYYDLAVEYLDFPPCVILIGPRQCGKTTLLKEIGLEWPVFDLELSADFDYVKTIRTSFSDCIKKRLSSMRHS